VISSPILGEDARLAGLMMGIDMMCDSYRQVNGPNVGGGHCSEGEMQMNLCVAIWQFAR
jgi:hypothetical protein